MADGKTRQKSEKKKTTATGAEDDKKSSIPSIPLVGKDGSTHHSRKDVLVAGTISLTKLTDLVKLKAERDSSKPKGAPELALNGQENAGPSELCVMTNLLKELLDATNAKIALLFLLGVRFLVRFPVSNVKSPHWVTHACQNLSETNFITR